MSSILEFLFWITNIIAPAIDTIIGTIIAKNDRDNDAAVDMPFLPSKKTNPPSRTPRPFIDGSIVKRNVTGTTKNKYNMDISKSSARTQK